MHKIALSACITFVAGMMAAAVFVAAADGVGAGSQSDPAAAGGTPPADNRSTTDRRTGTGAGSPIIWNGLWNGANLNFRLADESLRRVTGSSAQPGSNGGSQPNQTNPSGADTPPATNRYVAMGDSVAAGAGLTPPAGATSRDRVCRRSAEAYPHQVAQARGLELVHVACNGATAGDLVTRQRIDQAPNPSRQIAAIFAGGRPALVSVTAGANDVRWSNFILKCYRLACGPEARNQRISDSQVLNGLLELLQLKWDAFFVELMLRSNGAPPPVLVTGYYNPLSNACSQQAPGLTAAEIAWLDDSVAALNQTIEQVVERYPNGQFVPVDFSGHDICSAEPWVQGLNDPAPIHPTAEGQRVIAAAVLERLR